MTSAHGMEILRSSVKTDDHALGVARSWVMFEVVKPRRHARVIRPRRKATRR